MFIRIDKFIIEDDLPLFMHEFAPTMGVESGRQTLASYMLRGKIFKSIQ